MTAVIEVCRDFVLDIFWYFSMVHLCYLTSMMIAQILIYKSNVFQPVNIVIEHNCENMQRVCTV